MNKQSPARRSSAAAVSLSLFCILSAFSRPALCAPRASASASSPTPPLAERNSDDIQKEAVTLLKNGRRFDIAIAELTYIIRRDRHADRVARNYLGCALAAQAYAYATYLDDKATFARYNPDLPPDRMTVLWQQAQQRGSGIMYNVRLPAPPSPPKMLDDSKCNLSDEELPKVMADTTRHAESLLGFVLPNALKSASPKPIGETSPSPLAPTPDSVLDAEQLDDRAWAELLLRLGPLSHMDARYESWAIAEAMEDNLRAALKKDDSVRQQKCLGDALVLSCTYPRLRGSYDNLDYDTEMLKRGLETLTSVADKVPGHAAAWFFIGSNQYEKAPSDALASWKKAASYNHDNAIYSYACASIIISAAMMPIDWKKPLDDATANALSDCLSAGSACSYLAPVDYKVDSPITTRWAFRDIALLNWQTSSISLYLCTECGKKTKAKDFQGALVIAHQIATISNFFLNASKDQHLSEEQTRQCIRVAWSSLRDTAYEVGEIKVASPDRSITADLDYYLEVMTDNVRSSLEKRLQ